MKRDAIAHSPGALQQLKNQMGALEPLGPALRLPEVLDDTQWLNGFAGGWDDKDATSIYAFLGFVDYTSKINRTLVSEADLGQLDQLWDPKWKGQIAMFDPRIGGAGQQAVGLWYLTLGADRVRQLLHDQQPTVTQDRRQLGEWVIRGEYPVGVGVAPDSLATFIAEGVDTSMVQPLAPDDTRGVVFTFGTGSVGLFNHAPHPNAAQVFVNWTLSQNGQAAFSKDTGHNSRRLDVPVFDPLYAADPTRQYTNIDLEVNYDAPRNAVAQIAKEELT